MPLKLTDPLVRHYLVMLYQLGPEGVVFRSSRRAQQFEDFGIAEVFRPDVVGRRRIRLNRHGRNVVETLLHRKEGDDDGASNRAGTGHRGPAGRPAAAG